MIGILSLEGMRNACVQPQRLKQVVNFVNSSPPQFRVSWPSTRRPKRNSPRCCSTTSASTRMLAGRRPEIATRIHELQEAQGLDPWAKGKTRTPLREQVTQLNRNKKTKAMLTAYVSNELGMMLSGNETMAQMEYKAIPGDLPPGPAIGGGPSGLRAPCQPKLCGDLTRAAQLCGMGEEDSDRVGRGRIRDSSGWRRGWSVRSRGPRRRRCSS